VAKTGRDLRGGAGIRAAIETLLADPERLGLLADEVTDVVRETVPAYERIPAASLRAASREVLVTGLGHLRDRRTPDQDDLDRLMDLVRDRAEQGVDLPAVLAAYQIGGRHCWLALSRELDGVASPAELLDLTQAMWRWLDRVTLAITANDRDIAHRLALLEERRLADVLRPLLTAPATETATEQYLLQLGLATHATYAVFRGRARVGLAELRAALPVPVVVATLGQEVAGLAVATDELELDRVPAAYGTFGVGPVVPAGALHRSYLAAGQALAASVRLGRTGVHRLRDLRLAAVAATDDELTAVLTERILVPLRAKGGYAGDIWRAVVCYLEQGQRVDATAEHLHMHANTVRHRLAHFTALTGLDPRRPADVAEIWWLMVLGLGPT
jgi:hypothetical protein